MKQIILAVSMICATIGISTQAQTRAVTQVTSEVVCHECACGRDHYIETQRIVEHTVPTSCKRARSQMSCVGPQEAVVTAAAIVATSVAVVLFVAIAPEVTVFFGFMWFVSSIFCVR